VSFFAPDLDVRDLLIIDDRGRGLSGTIDCPELQHGTAPFAQAEADCAAQLGDAASRYGTGDVAEDVDAVRAALGYDKVDYFGLSYGGADITAYATRFGEHLRSMVLDSPYGPPDLSPFVAEHYRTHSQPRMVRLDCVRSPTCAPDHPDPGADLDELIEAIRLNPVQGTAHDANGNLLNVRIDEDFLLDYIVGNFPTGVFTSIGELLAASASLKRRDPAPLLRLGAEGFSPLWGQAFDAGDPTIFSYGANRATACVDAHEPWEWGAPVSERMKQYAEAASDLPSDYFAPFSKAAGTGLLSWPFGKPCIWWQRPTPSSPVAPPHAIYPAVPTLVLGGDMDNILPLEGTTKLAALFPNSTFVTVAEAGHVTISWTQCAANLTLQFIETLLVGDTSCADTPETVWPAVGRFPLLADEARPADIDPNGNNQIGLAERRVVTVAVAAATDAMQRSILGSGYGVGLRAGTFHTDYGATAWTTTLNDCAFAEDVTVNGTVTWGFFSFVADLTVSGSGTAGGTLHVDGTWLAPGPVGNFKITGILGGKQVAALVPEA
jgi:pimeloyl-ACP methyl ester carboxylesterase